MNKLTLCKVLNGIFKPPFLQRFGAQTQPKTHTEKSKVSCTSTRPPYSLEQVHNSSDTCARTTSLCARSGIEVNQGHKLLDLQARHQPGPHDQQGDMGAAFKHRHLVELPVLHGQLSVVRRKDHNSVVQQAGRSQS
ncbi:hypothetical protein EYF80_050972 [Liparis tanakae]|uniref:Uncharacterized protein n=1 Tax=Liparis tanakae TaxID=230148 RepID=A0A4Z2FDJ8_9TELE|nr:hypothetical protein EYF80_050972 [Liparis tanakae]